MNFSNSRKPNPLANSSTVKLSRNLCPKENTAQFKAIWVLTSTGYSNPNASPALIQNCAVPLVVDRQYPILQSLPGKRIPRDENGEVANTFAIAPDWTIEILSPDQSQTKVVRNILHSLSHGTQMGWLIDPEEELVFVYFADRTIAVFEEPGDRIPVPTFAESFNLTVGDMFSWLTE